ncbi:MAG TPA: amino acid adenylation domain-containing protein, partial [Thermoanaerobaculia bacterium]|nr:amino acid adenylation domain-containing protein [Thermoanaerobaculia bacterium]
RDPIEGLLAGIWEELLGRERVGMEDDFFALGGHSLLATQVVSRVRETFGVELPVHDLFERSTIARLARALRPLLRGRALGELPPIEPVPRPADGELPLSFAQQRLWFIDQLEPGNPVYNVPWAARLTGELDAGRLRRVLAEVVRRHEALRTTFARSPRGPVSRVLAHRPVALPVVALEALPEGAAAAEAGRLARAEAAGGFDLARGPLLRATLLRLGARQHVLIAVLHHIVSDGWSMGVLLREVGTLYRAFAAGEPSPLAELPIQYADFALWQRAWLQGEALADQLAYWREELAGAPLLLELPADRRRPAEPIHRGGGRSILLPSRLARELSAFSRREGVTLFMTLLAAFGALLGRLANQEDVLVGSPIANRTRREIEELIGFFVNTLVLRVGLGGVPRPSFRDLLGRVRRTALGAYAHQDLPFERLVEELVTDRRGGYPPLVQVILVLQNAPLVPLSLPGLTVSPLSAQAGVARVDLTLLFEETQAGLTGWLEYDAALFDRTTAERLLARFAGLLESALGEPDRQMGELGLLLAGERAQLAREWNDSASLYPHEAGLGELFGQWARVQPQAPAVVETGEPWSYGRLEAESNRLAWYLRSLGVEGEARVGVAMERSAALVVALLAVVKAGGAYVPLDASYPDDRLRFMLADSGATVVLVHGRTRQRLAGLAAGAGAAAAVGEVSSGEPADSPPWRLVCVETDENLTALPGAASPPHQGRAQEIAYLLYTSGSTGRPKGVAVPHRAAARLVRGTNYIELGPQDRLSMVSSISFDPSIFEVWGALANGGAVVVIERETALSPRRLAKRLRQEGVTAMFLATALFHQVAREEPAAFGSLRHLLVGGDALDPVAARRVLAAGPPRRLLNVYGPTESTTFATWEEVREVAVGALTVPIGRRLSNTTAYVVEPSGELAAVDQVGELWLGGDGLARGYFNRPELTAEKFVPDPWSGEPGGRLYRTGDLVRRHRNGALDCLGRIDHQVKIRGFRVEPGEVEAVLAGCPGVRDCAVVVRRAPGRDPARSNESPGRASARFNQSPGEARLVAYVVPAPGASLRETAVRDYLVQALPDHMVPAACLFLESLPLTPNGKLDRKALPEPAGAPDREIACVGPRDTLEAALVEIWEEILEPRPIGVRDDFFELGGHSLLAVQLMARIERRLGAVLPVATLLRRPTIEGLAAAMSERAAPSRHALVELEPGGGRPFFCIHPVGGDVLCYVRLARHLAGERSVWGLQVPDLAAGRAPATIEEMAAHYLQCIKELQPEGPYDLGGWSLGGVVAFEMARQLEGRGETVELLALIDSFAPGCEGRPERVTDGELVGLFAHDLARRLDGAPRVSLPDLARLTADDALRRLAAEAERLGLLPPWLLDGALERRFAVFQTNYRALERYTGGPCAAPLIVFKAAEPLIGAARPEPDLGWGRLTRRPVEVREVVGNHYTLLEEHHVDTLASLLRERLVTVAPAGGEPELDRFN